jgi:hypothetical protein
LDEEDIREPGNDFHGAGASRVQFLYNVLDGQPKQRLHTTVGCFHM